MIEDILLTLYSLVLFIALIFPVIFAFYRKLNNKLLFIGSVYGINYIVWILIVFSTAPINAGLIFIVPTLKEIELVNNILWLIAAYEFAEAYWWIFANITLFVFPMLINRRYKFAF